MIAISVLLLLIGVPGLILSLFMFGDIAIAAGIGSMTAILSSIGIFIGWFKINSINSKQQDVIKRLNYLLESKSDQSRSEILTTDSVK